MAPDRLSRAPPPPSGAPHPSLGVPEAIAITVGIVIGAGIFRTPSLVANVAASEEALIGAWAAGGLISLVGALCYAELASAYPHVGGDYHYLGRAFGSRLSFLYAWARLAVIQTGSIALLAFIAGDYLSELLDLGSRSADVYAALVVILLTALNWAGVRHGTRTQKWLTVAEIAGVAAIIIAGLTLDPAPRLAAPAPASNTDFGLVMVFVLLTYGGWSEVVYVSAELREARRRMVHVLAGSLALVTLLYLLANIAYLRALGMAGMAKSNAVAADLMERALGAPGVALISALVVISALTSANATMITGARSAYALGRDHPRFARLGVWNQRTGTPRSAMLVQGGAALLLVGMGSLARDGFRTALEYTAPIFWLFFLLVGLSLFILRAREPGVVRPFRVPLYPILPLLFCLSSAYLLYASLAYTGIGALVGVGVLMIGVLLLMLPQPEHSRTETQGSN